jgi:tetratricopeptide (TPR) repeat protein
MAREDAMQPLESLPAAARVDEVESTTRVNQLLSSGKPRDALAMMLRLQSQHPDDVKYWQGLEQIYEALNEPENAVDACRKGIALDPGIAALHAQMGVQLVKLKKWPEALVAFKKASEVGSKDPLVYAGAGVCCANMKDWPKAESFYRYAIKLSRPTTDIYGLLAQAQNKQGRTSDAVATLEEALKIDPTDPRIHCDLGDGYLRLGEFDKASKHYNLVLRYDPNSQFARHARAMLVDLVQRMGTNAGH